MHPDLIVRSPAKINLHLRIGPNGPDGFHPLMSWFATVGLADTLRISDSAQISVGPGIRLACDREDVPTDETNLIVRAGAMLDPQRRADVVLEKRIPMGGGLGGGSSNAAFALMGFNELWGLKWDTTGLAAAGAKLGSDVPFFFFGPSSVCTGRGEQVKPISRPAARFVVLMFPKLSMPTPAVYRQFDAMGLGRTRDIEEQPDWGDWTFKNAADLLPLLVNDLEAPAFAIAPQLGELRKKLEEALGRIVRMSGSGSTLFTLADGPGEANVLALAASKQGVEASAFTLAE